MCALSFALCAHSCASFFSPLSVFCFRARIQNSDHFFSRLCTLVFLRADKGVFSQSIKHLSHSQTHRRRATPHFAHVFTAVISICANTQFVKFYRARSVPCQQRTVPTSCCPTSSTQNRSPARYLDRARSVPAMVSVR